MLLLLNIYTPLFIHFRKSIEYNCDIKAKQKDECEL